MRALIALIALITTSHKSTATPLAPVNTVNKWHGARTARHIVTGEIAPWLALDGGTLYLDSWENLRTDDAANWLPNY